MNFKSLMSILLLCGLLLVSGFTTLSAQETTKQKITKLDDLPRHSYKITGKVSEMVNSDEAFGAFAAELRANLEETLKNYEISDKTTLKNIYGTLLTLDLLESKFDAALEKLELIKSLQEKPADKYLTGLFSNTYIRARKETAPGDEAAFKKAFAQYYAEAYKDLPWDIVQDQVQQSKGMTEMVSENLLLGLIQTKLDPVVEKAGEISGDLANRCVNFRYIMQIRMGLKDEIIQVLQTYIDAHNVVKPDIWKERSVALSPAENFEPVVVCVWDSGVDTMLYPDQLFVNEKEQLDGKDNDGNGFIDDRHGIAYTLHEDKSSEMLYPMDDSLKRKLPEMTEFMKGMLDLQASIDSKEASALKKQMAQMKPEEAKPLFERLGLFGNYMHGTHVGGISVEGNPFARILISRLTFDYHMIPETPTVEMARKSVVSTQETIDYFKTNNVRVVNMSWGGDLKGVESALEANGVGETPEERAKLAREIFDISKNGLYEAIKSAPEILFITSAGNSDNDVAFDEVIPSSFDLPNIMVVGAVDQAGEETSFSSFGENIDVHANGFEVESFLPGGQRMAVSGTSQASPQVTNLAAKLMAKNPSLTVAEVIALIKDGIDMGEDGRCNLINPKKSMALLAERMNK